jgi:glycosyltransferase involved in cell wall biosynthesis
MTEQATVTRAAPGPAPAGNGRGAPPRRRPIRVCFLIDALSPAGTETQLLALIRNLDRGRVEPYLCLLSGADATSRALEPDCCAVVRLGVRSFRDPATLVKLWRFRRFLRRERIDVLQAYFPASTYLGVPVGWLAGVPRIVRTRNNLGYWVTPWHRRLGRLCGHLSDVLVANCEACRQSVVSDEGLDPRHIVVLENGVDLARFPFEPWAASAERPPVRRVGIVANLRPVKELDVFVRAAADVSTAHRDITFQIAGEGELRPALEGLIAELGLADRFSLPGTVQNVPSFLAGLDVAVLCSRSEGMSNAVLEYMAAGRPIVATAVGGNVELLQGGKNGLLVPPGDAGALAAAIQRLLEDPALAARLASAARRRVEEHHSREAMVRRFEAFFEDLMRGPAPGSADGQ